MICFECVPRSHERQEENFLKPKGKIRAWEVRVHFICKWAFSFLCAIWSSWPIPIASNISISFSEYHFFTHLDARAQARILWVKVCMMVAFRLLEAGRFQCLCRHFASYWPQASQEASVQSLQLDSCGGLTDAMRPRSTGLATLH